MTGPVAAILLTLIVHLIAFVLLFAMMGREMLDTFRSPKRGDDGDDGGLGFEPQPAAPGPSDGGLPLPDAEQAPKRLREPGRIAEQYPRRPRRPEHVPDPAPAPDRETV
jgi:hypothetical protein